MELFQFDEQYLRRLQNGDPETEAHFVSYFGALLRIKLRSRNVPSQVIDDVRQETFLRVIAAVRSDSIRQPQSLGAYVNTVCKNVLMESYRAHPRSQSLDENPMDVPDKTDLEDALIKQERKQRVREVLNELPLREQKILRAVLEERNKSEVCKEFGVDPAYLRVLLHRARNSFRAQYKKMGNTGTP